MKTLNLETATPFQGLAELVAYKERAHIAAQ